MKTLEKRFDELLTSGDITPEGPTAADIRRRAYEKFCARGGIPGDPVLDWLQAEQELTTERKATRGAATKPAAGLDSRNKSDFPPAPVEKPSLMALGHSGRA